MSFLFIIRDTNERKRRGGLLFHQTYLCAESTITRKRERERGGEQEREGKQTDQKEEYVRKKEKTLALKDTAKHMFTLFTNTRT